MQRKQRIVEPMPNQAVDGYYHVSVSPDGFYRSTLRHGNIARRGHLSRRQQLKRDKLARRLVKEDRETAN